MVDGGHGTLIIKKGRKKNVMIVCMNVMKNIWIINESYNASKVNKDEEESSHLLVSS